jgi:hypothetical protein
MLAHLEKPWLAHRVMSSTGADNLALFPSIGPCFGSLIFSSALGAVKTATNQHIETPTHQIIL